MLGCLVETDVLYVSYDNLNVHLLLSVFGSSLARMQNSEATRQYRFNQAHLQEFGEVLQARMIRQVPGG
jgi:hypothetical protein